MRVPRFRSYLALFFFNGAATAEIYTLSLHDALPIWCDTGLRDRGELPDVRRGLPRASGGRAHQPRLGSRRALRAATGPDRKSTRLNSSHPSISYAVFCLKKKNQLGLSGVAIGQAVGE